MCVWQTWIQPISGRRAMKAVSWEAPRPREWHFILKKALPLPRLSSLIGQKSSQQLHLLKMWMREKHMYKWSAGVRLLTKRSDIGVLSEAGRCCSKASTMQFAIIVARIMYSNGVRVLRNYCGNRLLRIQTQTLSLKQYINTPELNMTYWKINHKLFENTTGNILSGRKQLLGVQLCISLTNVKDNEMYFKEATITFEVIFCLAHASIASFFHDQKKKKELLSIIFWHHQDTVL